MSHAEILAYDPIAIERAAGLIAQNRPVAVPTETVYGLAADATSGEAVAAIYAAKGRPSFNPLIVHVLDVSAAEALAVISAAALRLMERFWPGPLTIVAPLRSGTPIASLATAGLPTVALRAPAHRAMRSLLRATEKPLAAPSANASGTISPTRAEHVFRSLGKTIPLIIDDGATAVGLESTIVGIAGAELRILRPGPITAEQLSTTARMPIHDSWSGAITAPGQLAQHYAPSKPLRLEALVARGEEWLIGFGDVPGDVTLSRSGDLVEAAAKLFALLHAADIAAAPRIAVAPIPFEGLGVAINDRLRRAAS